MKNLILVVLLFLTGSCTCSMRAQTIGGGQVGGGTISRAAGDVTAPTISPNPPVESSVTSSSAAVIVTTNEVALCRIRYGTSTGVYGTTLSYETVYGTSHSLSITSLSASTQYFYVVDCKDGVPNTGTSSEDSFTTSASGGSALLPSYGIEVDGVNNSTLGKERNVILPAHYSETQFQPAAFSVTAGGCVRASNVVTCTLTSNPTTTSPRLYTGFQVVVAGMTDTGFNGTFTLTNVTSTTVVWSQVAGNATTDGGTVRSTIFTRPSQGTSYADPQFNNTPVERLYDHANGPGTCPANGTTHFYVNNGPFSKNLTHLKQLCRSGHWYFLGIVTKANTCYNTFGSGSSTNVVWSKTDNDIVYFTSSNKIRKLTVSTCTATDVVTFTGFTNTYIGGEGGNQDGDSVLNAAGTKTLIPIVLYDSSSVRHVTVLNAEDGTYPTPYNTTCTSPRFIDNFRVWPSAKAVYMLDITGSAACNGTHLLNSDMTYSRQITTLTGHSTIGVSAEGDDVLVTVQNSSGIAGPCSSKMQGTVMFRASDSQQTCLWNKTNNDNAGTGSQNTGTYAASGDMRSPWIVVDQRNSGLERLESGMVSTWSTSWGRGTNEAVLCKLTTGTSSCYRMAFTRGTVGDATGVEFYNGHHWCVPSLIEDGVNTASVPKYILCSSDFRTATGTAGAQHEPILITVR